MLDLVIFRDILVGFFIVGVLLRASHVSGSPLVAPKGPIVDDAWREKFLQADDNDNCQWDRTV